MTDMTPEELREQAAELLTEAGRAEGYAAHLRLHAKMLLMMAAKAEADALENRPPRSPRGQP